MTVDARAELPSAVDSDPDVIIVEERLLGRSAQAAHARLRELARRAAVVVTGMSERSLAEVVDAASSAAGYWSIDGPLEDLVDLVRAASHAPVDGGVSSIRI